MLSYARPESEVESESQAETELGANPFTGWHARAQQFPLPQLVQLRYLQPSNQPASEPKSQVTIKDMPEAAGLNRITYEYTSVPLSHSRSGHLWAPLLPRKSHSAAKNELTALKDLLAAQIGDVRRFCKWDVSIGEHSQSSLAYRPYRCSMNLSVDSGAP